MLYRMLSVLLSALLLLSLAACGPGKTPPDTSAPSSTPGGPTSEASTPEAPGGIDPAAVVAVEEAVRLYQSGTTPENATQLPEGFPHVRLCEDVMEVISSCDFLSAHLPLNEETRNFISRKELQTMRPGSCLINTARGGIVDEDALYEALTSGRLAGAAMDVAAQEPMKPDHPLLSLDNVVVTPHIGMYSKEAIGAVSVICAENAAAMLSGGALKFQVV